MEVSHATALAAGKLMAALSGALSERIGHQRRKKGRPFLNDIPNVFGDRGALALAEGAHEGVREAAD